MSRIVRRFLTKFVLLRLLLFVLLFLAFFSFYNIYFTPSCQCPSEIGNSQNENKKWRPNFFVERPRPPPIFFVTPSVRRPEQKADLTRLGQTLAAVANLVWILVEVLMFCFFLICRGISFIDQLVARLGIDAVHLCAETPEKWRLRLDDPHWKYPKGVLQRNAALRWLRKNVAHQHVGAVYFGDDDNTYDWRLFDEIRLLKRVGIWPVGIVGGMLAEFAYVNANAIVSGFNAKWKPSRPFPIDMAAFAVNISLIHEHAGAEFSYKSPRGFLESHFLSALNFTRTDLEPLAKNGTRVYVWHTRTAQTQLRAKQIGKFYGANVSTLAEAEKDAIS
ncbi:hypothetical protein niasHT_029069 [Heterodera trifolii]|uniref:Galactosylgalactosylxylosylprotein 3-beta-glucuronosyltransferase n=1 Tax=Heterodera trifolii TaxID=157864 RepID=A0ABD2KS08_9BILA